MTFCRLLRLLLLVSLLAVTLPAGAQAPEASARPVEAEFERGVAAADRGDWAQAEQAFARVCEGAPTANALLNLATARYHQQKPVSALQALDQLASMDQVSAAERATGQRMRERVTGMLARLSVYVDPPSASVTMDGVTLPPERRRMSTDPGTHELNASASGYTAKSLSIQVEPGEHRSVHLSLIEDREPVAAVQPVAASPAIAPGSESARVDAPASKSRKRWLWALGAAVVVAGAAVAVAVPLANRDPGCSSATVSLGGCAP